MTDKSLSSNLVTESRGAKLNVPNPSIIQAETREDSGGVKESGDFLTDV